MDLQKIRDNTLYTQSPIKPELRNIRSTEIEARPSRLLVHLLSCDEQPIVIHKLKKHRIFIFR